MSTLLKDILNYEAKLFEEYSLKRNNFLENLKTIKTNNLSQSQLLIFIHDIKEIIDPLKLSMENMDYYFTNTSFTKNDSIENSKKKLFYCLIDRFFTNSSELVESSELTEEISSEPDSDSSESE